MNEEKPYIEHWSMKSEFNIRVVLEVLIARWHWFALSVFYAWDSLMFMYGPSLLSINGRLSSS